MSMCLSPGIDNAEQPFKLWWAHIGERGSSWRTLTVGHRGKHNREGTCHDEALRRKAWCALKRGRSLCVEEATGWEVLLL